MSIVKIRRALISVFYKDGLEPLIHYLAKQQVEFISTGGTKDFIEKLGYPVVAVEKLTGYPEVFGGRVKTLHPAVFGGILFRRNNENDLAESRKYNIDPIDLIVVDLYPFEETIVKGSSEEDIIEKIDIGGISLIRAAAKNYSDTLIISSRKQYSSLITLLQNKDGRSDEADRFRFATEAFAMTSHYDSAIFSWFNTRASLSSFNVSFQEGKPLRYGENPHQSAVYYGDLNGLFDQLNGKELSYNNLVDVDAAVGLIAEFSGETIFAIIKHTNACGVASANTVRDAYLKALQADPVSAFGGILATNRPVDLLAAEEINKLFFEILIAPDYSVDALELLKVKKNRIILKQHQTLKRTRQFKSLLNGVIEQDADTQSDVLADLKPVTNIIPDARTSEDLLVASKICKNTKSNAIVLVSGGQMLASGVGQTSRVDALRQALEKAKSFGLSVQGSAMASDAFFPFPDCVEIAAAAGIKSIIQPGGSIKDQDSIDACNRLGLSMVFTGKRHFLH